MRRAATPLCREDAVSDVVGSLLLVGITVGMMVALSLVVLGFDGPVDRLHADIDARLDAGADGTWGTGDEQVLLKHRGGEPAPQRDMAVIIDQNGVRTRYAGSELDGGFGDGSFTTGETWNEVRSISLVDKVTVLVTFAGDGSRVVTSSVLSAPAKQPAQCLVDTVAPTVGLWEQVPADVTALSSGPVTVNATLSDACSGMDDTVVPHLYYRIEDGSSPGFTDAGAMTDQGTFWQGTIPDLGWLAEVGNALEYRVFPLTDQDGNTGASAVREDLIGITGTKTFVDSSTVTKGTETSFANAQNDADGDAASSLTDALTLGATTSTALSSNAVVAAGGWTNGANAFASDDADARASGNNPAAIRFDVADAADGGAINSVVVSIEAAGSATNAGFMVGACLQGTCTTSGVFTPTLPLVDQTFSHNFTAQHPLGNGTWTWADVRALQIDVDPAKSGGGGNPDYALDHAYLTVGSLGDVYELDAEYHWTGVPAGVNVLEIKYRVLNGDSYDMQVWDGGAYASRTTLSGTAWQTYMTPLSVGEYNLGSPMIRFDDQSDVQGILVIAHAKVVTG